MAAPTLPETVIPTVRQALAEALEAHRRARLGEAEQLYCEILRAEPGQAEALHGLGLLAQQSGDVKAAARWMRAAIDLDPGQARYRSNLGNVLQMQGLLADAVVEYERALQLQPDSAVALSNLGAALLALGRPQEAAQRLRQAARLRPDSAQVQDNLGNALQSLGLLEEAAERHEQALALCPANPETLGNLGLALAGMGRWQTALASFEQALAIAPGNARIQLARAQLQLLLGDFASGLPNYEWRTRVHSPRPLPGRRWRGEPLGAKETIVLYAEQGLGDTIQCLRYVPWVRSRLGEGGDLALEVQEPLRRLASEMPGVRQVTVPGEAQPQFDWHSSLMSLPLLFHAANASTRAGSSPPPIPDWRGPYLRLPNAAAQAADRFLPAPGGANAGLRVGLVWAGNRSHARDRFRSIPFSLLTPLFEIAGVSFHSLQLGEAEAGAQGPITDWTGAIADLADTAARIERLDLILGVDTAIIHLAGALEKPVWTLLPFWPDWRWGLGREDCPWYPTMRLFRQREPGDWSSVIEAVRRALTVEVQERRLAGGKEPPR